MILRAATSTDVEALLDVQQVGAVLALAHVFPQDRHPFPREALAARWRAEIVDPAVDVRVCTDDDGVLLGFAAVRGEELLHFGTGATTWGTGLATRFHDALLASVEARGGALRTLHVFEENRRARRFYAKLAWRPTGARSRTTFPPYPVLLEYARA